MNGVIYDKITIFPGNSIGCEGARMVSEALTINSALSVLHLDCMFRMKYHSSEIQQFSNMNLFGGKVEEMRIK